MSEPWYSIATLSAQKEKGAQDLTEDSAQIREVYQVSLLWNQ